MKADGTRHTLADIYHERTEFDFVGRSWRWALLSGTLVLVSLIALFANGLNLGIDFRGGTAWVVNVEGKKPSVPEVRAVLDPIGLSGAKVQILGSTTIRVQFETVDQPKQIEVSASLAKYAGVADSAVSVSTVGPTWGNQVTRNALKALLVFFIVIAIYLSLRFEWRMALAAIAAVAHDIVITVGVYALFQWEVAPATVVAFLTILGFSLYDTVVVFDKIKENRVLLGTNIAPTYSAMVNVSMNEVLMRSLNTSFIAVLPVAGLLVIGVGAFGAKSLETFAIALFVGLVIGAYSSIFVATPILNWMKEREPSNRTLMERWRAAGSPRPTASLTLAAETLVAAEEAQTSADSARTAPTESAPPSTGSSGTGASGEIAPRPRRRTR
ncbi:MAG: protein translocase subunit SecF [Acidimicrobiia bacterium]